MTTIIPDNYIPLLDAFQTENAIRKIKHAFEQNIMYDLDLLRVTAPLFVESGYGLNDDLNGTETPVHFPVKGMGNKVVEIVHSLAKWKRLQLHLLNVPVGEGIVTDMNAIRPEEDLDNIHSIYVDQWDWEKTISSEQRNSEKDLPFNIQDRGIHLSRIQSVAQKIAKRNYICSH